MKRPWPALFAAIAVPRLPGTAALEGVEREVCDTLEALGFSVELQAFTASPRRLAATATAGAALGWVALGLAPLLLLPVPGWPVALIGLAALALVGLVAQGVAAGHLPVGGVAVPAANIVATRGTPALWLVAHSDSKSQRLSLRSRAVGAVVAAAGCAGLPLVLAWRLAGPVPPWAVLAVCGLALAGGAALSLGAAQNGSPGAVDNATGIVAALAAAQQLADRDDVGVLVTGAEEFGMEGARAWAAAGKARGAFINFDGVDSRGRYRIQRHRPQGGAHPHEKVSRELERAFGERGLDAVVARLPFGVFVDGAVLAGAGMPGATVSRGDLVTLGVVHTARDGADRVDPAAAVAAGEAAASAVRRLLG